MNFIKHFLQFMDFVMKDERLTPYHVSLYFALFNSWNMNHFRNPISISRSEIMIMSKIGSVNTYTRCMKELHSWGYIRYDPSYNPQVGSKVYLYRFDKGSDKAGGQLLIKPVRPSLNNINYINNNKSKGERTPLSDVIKVNSKKEGSDFLPPNEQEVLLFFQSQFPLLKDILKTEKNAELEARKFFNYFKSVGWKVGNNKQMEDWQAAATNWILNSGKYSNPKNHQPAEPNHLHINNNKNYDEPL